MLDTAIKTEADLQAAMDARIERNRVADRARGLLELLITEPGNNRNRVDLSNCIAFLETIDRGAK